MTTEEALASWDPRGQLDAAKEMLRKLGAWEDSRPSMEEILGQPMDVDALSEPPAQDGRTASQAPAAAPEQAPLDVRFSRGDGAAGNAGLPTELFTGTRMTPEMLASEIPPVFQAAASAPEPRGHVGPSAGAEPAVAELDDTDDFEDVDPLEDTDDFEDIDIELDELDVPEASGLQFNFDIESDDEAPAAPAGVSDVPSPQQLPFPVAAPQAAVPPAGGQEPFPELDEGFFAQGEGAPFQVEVPVSGQQSPQAFSYPLPDPDVFDYAETDPEDGFADGDAELDDFVFAEEIGSSGVRSFTDAMHLNLPEGVGVELDSEFGDPIIEPAPAFEVPENPFAGVGGTGVQQVVSAWEPPAAEPGGGDAGDILDLVDFEYDEPEGDGQTPSWQFWRRK